MEKKYYKVLPEDLTKRGFRYQEGLNVDTLPIRPVVNGWGNWGMHFRDINQILGVVSKGTMIADVEIPEDAIVYEFPMVSKANKLILKNIRPLWNIEVFKELERQGADIHGDKEHLLHSAAEIGSLDMVKYFAEEEGADIHGFYNGGTVIMRAAEKGHLDVVKYLTGRGVDIHTYMEAPLCLAGEHGHLEVVKHLVEQGADIDKYKELLFFEAAEHGQLNMVKYMMGYGCYDCHVALHIAAENGWLEVVKFFAEQGVDIHAEDEIVLRSAVEHDYALDVVKYLVEQGADIHSNNEAPLCKAVAEGALNVVKYLVEQGADIHARNDYPLRVAKAENYQSMVEYLMSCLEEEQ